ncbi:hypothetical protein [Paenibacillus crassostreae]|uniref:Uncharacterized protein n=1 Tax=Paenibacillus crassostreae TaxID=1763538 RepID=A0A167C5H8_9BACL|nr:hypothetical protein [Paenibacillus crassostreae]AOZ91624.1 hypothetical protein LPB68_04925 [Paenibacillus crassostreae]OAB72802.1 hypothetical protein PNBC_15325 [Paenibacillus crassostreae]
MIRKGEISSMDTVTRKARVTFKNLDSVVTAELPYADHVAPQINDIAIVALFSNILVDGMIIAVRREV